MSSLKRIGIVTVLSLFSLQSMTLAGTDENSLKDNFRQVALNNVSECGENVRGINQNSENPKDFERKQRVRIIAILSIMGLLIGGLSINFAINQK